MRSHALVGRWWSCGVSTTTRKWKARATSSVSAPFPIPAPPGPSTWSRADDWSCVHPSLNTMRSGEGCHWGTEAHDVSKGVRSGRSDGGKELACSAVTRLCPPVTTGFPRHVLRAESPGVRHQRDYRRAWVSLWCRLPVPILPTLMSTDIAPGSCQNSTNQSWLKRTWPNTVFAIESCQTCVSRSPPCAVPEVSAALSQVDDFQITGRPFQRIIRLVRHPLDNLMARVNLEVFCRAIIVAICKCYSPQTYDCVIVLIHRSTTTVVKARTTCSTVWV